MLPILPALLLLILQGPSSIERLAHEGRLPEALQAVSRQLEMQDNGSERSKDAEAAVLASLLAMGSDPDLSHALFQLLSLDQLDAPPTHSSNADLRVEPPDIPTYEISRIPDAFRTCGRTRDGPSQTLG
jgi:hypothetical protein